MQARGYKIVDTILKAGGGEGIRTPDPMVANHVLCQLSYTPESDVRGQMSDARSTVSKD